MSTVTNKCAFPSRLAGRCNRDMSRLLVAGIALVVVFGSPWTFAGWASMLLNCAAVFMALKHWVWLAVNTPTAHADRSERFAFYALWPGFDVGAFLDRAPVTERDVNWREAAGAAANTILAALLLWRVLPRFRDTDALLLGAGGMLCGVLLVHCGLFRFVALAWQAAGRCVVPIMNRPLAATSLVDFWSRRWNLAFRDAAALVLFRPMARRFSPHAASMATFLMSGLWHEAVISLPARGGYGLPTLYFLIQGVGMTLERRWLRTGQSTLGGIPGRAFTALVVLLPLPLLFHRPFAERVIVPLLNVLDVL